MLQRCISAANNAGALVDEFPRRSVGTIKKYVYLKITQQQLFTSPVNTLYGIDR